MIIVRQQQHHLTVLCNDNGETTAAASDLTVLCNDNDSETTAAASSDSVM